MLVGRSEGYLIGRTELGATVDRLVAYADAGADCLYAPGITVLSAIRTLVSAVAPKPANVLLIGPNMRVADLAEAGVRRVSTGGASLLQRGPLLIEPLDCWPTREHCLSGSR